MNWLSYTSLAWTERILSPPEDMREEAQVYIDAVKMNFDGGARTMLHLGCGAGGHDFHFRDHFEITGVDLCEEMLVMARGLNPEVRYFQGDMRSVRLDRKFDAVVVPDSIMYMTTIEDVKKVLGTAALHLVPGGVFLAVVHPKEAFRNNNFVYSGSDRETEVTVFENNHVVSDSTYEAVMVYLIRRGGDLQILHDVHTLGLFSHSEWMGAFDGSGLFMVEEIALDDLYDDFLAEDGDYRLKAYVCTFSRKKKDEDLAVLI